MFSKRRRALRLSLSDKFVFFENFFDLFFVFGIFDSDVFVKRPKFVMSNDGAVGFLTDLAEGFAFEEVFVCEGFERTAAVGIVH